MKTNEIIEMIENAKPGTHFYFEGGYELFKTRDDYGLTGCLPVYRIYKDGKKVSGYWGQPSRPRYNGLCEKLVEQIKTFGSFKGFVEGSDDYKPDPLFT